MTKLQVTEPQRALLQLIGEHLTIGEQFQPDDLYGFKDRRLTAARMRVALNLVKRGILSLYKNYQYVFMPTEYTFGWYRAVVLQDKEERQFLTEFLAEREVTK